MKKEVFNEVIFRGMPEAVIWKSDITNITENAKIYSRKDCDIIFLRKGAFLGAFNDRDEYYLANDRTQGFLDKLFHGSKTSDDCEIYYINRLVQLENLWGTADRIDIYDKDYDLHTTIGANGSYKFSINNSMKLFSKVKGAALNLSQDMVRDFFRSELSTEIRNAIASVFYKNKFGLKDIATITLREKEIAQEIHQVLMPVFLEYGVSLDKFYIARFQFDDEFLNQIRDYKKEIILNKMKFESEKAERENAKAEFKMQTKATVKINKSMPKEKVIVKASESDKSIETQTKIFCTNCGTANPKTNKKCSECQADL